MLSKQDKTKVKHHFKEERLKIRVGNRCVIFHILSKYDANINNNLRCFPTNYFLSE